MASIDPRTPCIIGVHQRTRHPGSGESPEPLELWEEAAHAAARDSGGRDVLAAVDRLQVVYPLSWTYDDAPRRLADRLGLREGARELSGLSGTSPQKFVQTAAEQILAGREDLALIVGGESLYTKKQMKKLGRRPEWSFRPEQKPGMPFDDPFHPAEIAHQVFQAYLTFAVFDVARRAHLGLSIESNRRQVAELLAPMSEVAAKNPHAWNQQVRSADELYEVTADNRMIADPYAKYVISIMDLDMSSAILVASHEKADALGVPRDRRISLRGWCLARDPVYVAERDELWRSPSMAEASAEALARAGATLDEIAYLDLYSCFGSSVNYACDALGIDATGDRALSITGGLPFHGGPGNNYMSHSIATMTERLREDPGALGMVSGVGMHMTNHCFAVYSAEPGAVSPPDTEAVQARVDAAVARRPIRERAEGPARIAAYSILHGREGAVSATLVCDLPGGERCYATARGAPLLEAMGREEWVGRPIRLSDGGGGVNLAEAGE